MSAPVRVSKRVFLGALTCPTKAWYLRHLPVGEFSEGDKLRIQEGTEIGERARRLFPGGVLVEERDLERAAAITAQLIADPKVAVILEATFLAGDYVAKADMLVRDRNGWEVVEVKSNKNLHDEMIEDLAYTVNVARHAGIQVTRAKLLLLSPEFRSGMSDAQLFRTEEQTDAAFELAEAYDEVWKDVPVYIKREQPLEPKLIWNCRQCDFFAGECLGKGIDNHVFDLPFLREAAFQKLCEQQITLIESIPDHFPLSDHQQRVRQAVSAGQPVVSHKELTDAMASIVWPARYLDFETVKTAVPLLPNLGPHETVVTQYSLHVRKSPRHNGEHSEYLADHRRDCRRELTESLLTELGDSGHILVYSSYEKTTLTGLAKLYPDLKSDIGACIERLFDLHAVIKRWLYLPEFRGQTSIKATLPALTDLNYHDLKIQNGDVAVAKFARLMRGEYDESQIPQVRAELLAYCKRDTLAMVELHNAILKYCK